jgi:hypothetical protein
MSKLEITNEERALTEARLVAWEIAGRYDGYLDEMSLLIRAWQNEKVAVELLKKLLVEEDALAYAKLRLIRVSISVKETTDSIIHDAIVRRCEELDKLDRLHVYSLTVDSRTYRLTYCTLLWDNLSHQERFVLVKTGNYFMSAAQAEAAIARAIDK